MFGTLIICLPSAHTGGEVVVQHCGKQRTYATSVHAQSYICWYSDVTHEVRPVTSGYRWVLTYNLALSDDQPSSAVSRPSAGLLDSSCVTARLRRALERWLSQPQTSRNRSLYHVLEHDYTQASVSLRKLKADDLARVEALNSACEGLEVDIFLALLEKEEEKEADYDDWGGYYDEEEPDSEEDEIDEMREPHVSNSIASVSYIVKNLVDLEGSQLADHLSLDTDDMIDPDAWDSLDDYDEEYQGYTGNEGHGDLYWYRISVSFTSSLATRTSGLTSTNPGCGDSAAQIGSAILHEGQLLFYSRDKDRSGPCVLCPRVPAPSHSGRASG